MIVANPACRECSLDRKPPSSLSLGYTIQHVNSTHDGYCLVCIVCMNIGGQRSTAQRLVMSSIEALVYYELPWLISSSVLISVESSRTNAAFI